MKIANPKTKKNHFILSKTGTQILRNYIKTYYHQKGGSFLGSLFSGSDSKKSVVPEDHLSVHVTGPIIDSLFNKFHEINGSNVVGIFRISPDSTILDELEQYLKSPGGMRKVLSHKTIVPDNDVSKVLLASLIKRILNKTFDKAGSKLMDIDLRNPIYTEFENSPGPPSPDIEIINNTLEDVTEISQLIELGITKSRIRVLKKLVRNLKPVVDNENNRITIFAMSMLIIMNIVNDIAMEKFTFYIQLFIKIYELGNKLTYEELLEENVRLREIISSARARGIDL